MSLKQSIEKELKVLERELRVELPQEIKTAVAMGDLRENAEYQSALERQRFLQSRIGQLKQRLSEISLIRTEEVPKDKIGLGSVFTVVDSDDDREMTYEIVMEGLGDPTRGLIAVSSPLARGFLNKKVGDEAVIRVPSGERSYEVTALKTVHDRD